MAHLYGLGIPLCVLALLWESFQVWDDSQCSKEDLSTNRSERRAKIIIGIATLLFCLPMYCMAHWCSIKLKIAHGLRGFRRFGPYSEGPADTEVSKGPKGTGRPRKDVTDPRRVPCSRIFQFPPRTISISPLVRNRKIQSAIKPVHPQFLALRSTRISLFFPRWSFTASACSPPDLS